MRQKGEAPVRESGKGWQKWDQKKLTRHTKREMDKSMYPPEDAGRAGHTNARFTKNIQKSTLKCFHGFKDKRY